MLPLEREFRNGNRHMATRIGRLCDTHKSDILTHQGMRTNIDINDELMAQAMRASGAQTKKGAVEAGLRLLAETHAQVSIRKLRGKVRWNGDLSVSRKSRLSG